MPETVSNVISKFSLFIKNYLERHYQKLLCMVLMQEGTIKKIRILILWF